MYQKHLQVVSLLSFKRITTIFCLILSLTSCQPNRLAKKPRASSYLMQFGVDENECVRIEIHEFSSTAWLASANTWNNTRRRNSNNNAKFTSPTSPCCLALITLK